MKIKFHIDYQTEWGQQICVCGSDPVLGNWNPKNAFLLNAESDYRWIGQVELQESKEPLEYKFLLIQDNSDHFEFEFGNPRRLNCLKEQFESIEINTFWRSVHSPSSNLYTSPFTQAFFKRKTQEDILNIPKGPRVIQFQLQGIRIGADYVFGVLGSIPELGNWKEERALLLDDADFPLWKQNVAVPKTNLEIEYKYVICNRKSGKVIEWESGDNRKVKINPAVKGLQVFSDIEFRYDHDWKGAGCAIPVFSLRSKQGIGVGEFVDLQLLVDWAKKTDIKLIQILPVNDTVANNTWTDSYPYAAISAFALHPIYANLQQIGKLKDKGLAKEIDREGKKLNQLGVVDYESVMSLKMRFYKSMYQQVKTELFESYSYREFFSANEEWLVPYGAFCALRDEHGTPDFEKWGEYSNFSRQKLNKLVAPNSKYFDQIGLYYFIQFHLDKQLREATAHARDEGIVLKGDIPIGIYRNSVDAWKSPGQYHMHSQAGAPPDDFTVNGQNWGFPTYNWSEMAKDGFKWWKDRLRKMSDYFDVFRIDHILGFFRIWEIPWQYVNGVMGHFNPSLPLGADELRSRGVHLDFDRLCKPYLRKHVVQHIFGSHSEMAFDTYLDEYAPDCFQFKEGFDTQRKVKDHFDHFTENHQQNDFNNWVRGNLYRLHSEVILIPAENESDAYNPGIAFHSTFSYRELDEHTQNALDRIYSDYFYIRHNDYWRNSAMQKLPEIKSATNMLVCGEDLGMVPACVPGVMNELNLLSLAIQRMPGNNREFWYPADTPYLSVTTTGSHDMPTLREWWQQNPDRSQRFFNHMLGREGAAPYYCETEIAQDIISQHMHSPSMWAIFPIQDLLAMDENLRRELPEEERINDPAIAEYYWRYRLHLNMEELLVQHDFNNELGRLIKQGGRATQY